MNQTTEDEAATSSTQPPYMTILNELRSLNKKVDELIECQKLSYIMSPMGTCIPGRLYSYDAHNHVQIRKCYAQQHLDMEWIYDIVIDYYPSELLPVWILERNSKTEFIHEYLESNVYGHDEYRRIMMATRRILRGDDNEGFTYVTCDDVGLAQDGIQFGNSECLNDHLLARFLMHKYPFIKFMGVYQAVIDITEFRRNIGDCSTENLFSFLMELAKYLDTLKGICGNHVGKTGINKGGNTFCVYTVERIYRQLVCAIIDEDDERQQRIWAGYTDELRRRICHMVSATYDEDELNTSAVYFSWNRMRTSGLVDVFGGSRRRDTLKPT